ncbi:MAG TPA: mu-protocadherin- cell-suface protein, partial [Planctomycetia bacterium]|nr:mu-protocadherin- cell-suface protein [Planctomycetia bacterium]
LDRPNRINNINTGDIRIGDNRVINNRPSWANINQNNLGAINNRWQGQMNNLQGWQNNHLDRAGYWGGWGSNVRGNWDHFHDCHDWFNDSWWGNHAHPWGGWHYGYGFANHAWSDWWMQPTYAAVSSWFTWPTPAPAQVWSEPVYYDYGSGGNVTYSDNSVYINGQQVSSAADFAESAAVLATVPPPASEAEAAAAEWMPLGTFAVSTNSSDAQPTRTVQLAVDRKGIISGTVFNSETGQAQSVQGQVDKNTQRVAFRIGENENVVVETGLYNLTQEEAPAMVHFGTDKTENWLLVRLEHPDNSEGAPATTPGG